MNNKHWIILFLLTLGLHIAGMYWPLDLLEKFTKPLLLVILISWFVVTTNSFQSANKKWVTLALCFSWLGDVLLMFQAKNPMFFLLGLSAFLIAHIFYIIFFHKIKVAEGVKSKGFLLLPVVIYYAVLIAVLYPYLADMKVPVPVYGLVISFMLLLALHMLFIRNKKAGQLMTAGALLFVISDSALAINKFYQPFEASGFVIMLTYGLAQLFIVLGAIHYISSQEAAANIPS